MPTRCPPAVRCSTVTAARVSCVATHLSKITVDLWQDRCCAVRETYAEVAKEDETCVGRANVFVATSCTSRRHSTTSWSRLRADR